MKRFLRCDNRTLPEAFCYPTWLATQIITNTNDEIGEQACVWRRGQFGGAACRVSSGSVWIWRTQTCRSGGRDGKDLVVNTSRGKRPLGTTAEDEKIRESEMNLLFPVLL